MPQIIMFDNVNFKKIVAINPVVSNKNFLTLDLWNFDDSEYKQLYYQVNDMHVSGFKKNNIVFDVTNNLNFVKFVHNLEDHLCSILKEYLSKHNKKGNFNMHSILSMRKEITTITTSIMYNDYNALLFDNMKNNANSSVLNNKNSKFNVIFELVALQLDMKEGTIHIDNRLRMVLEHKVSPVRTKLTDVTVFIQRDDTCSEPDQITDFTKEQDNISAIDEGNKSDTENNELDQQCIGQLDESNDQLSESSDDENIVGNMKFLNGNNDLVGLMSQLFMASSSPPS